MPTRALIADSEVEVVDVVLGERRQRAEHDLAVGADRVVAQPAGGELLALLAGDPPGDERRRGLAGEVADVLGHPQLELVDRPVLDELAHLVREAEPGELDLALLRRGRQVPRRRGHAHRRRRDDALEVRIRLDQALRLLEGLLVVVVAVGHLHELDVLVLGLLERLLHHLDPGVLVGRVRGRREDRDVALAADLLGDRLDLVLADQLRRDLVDEDAARVGRDVGVHADDLDALGGRLLERRGDGVGIVAGDDDRVRLLLDGGVDDRDLRRRAGVGRPRDPVGAAELLERLVDARVLELFVRVAELLRERDVLETLGDRGAGIRRARGRGRGRLRAAVRCGVLILGLAARGDDERRHHGQRNEQHTQMCGLHEPSSGSGRERRRRASATRRAMFGPRTEPTSSVPVTIWIQYDEIDSLSSSAFWMPPSSTSARITPAIVPRPPKIETPPSSTAVITVSSKPWPTFAAAVELRSEMTTPASPATAPDSVKRISFTRLTRRPEKYDASSLAPIA